MSDNVKTIWLIRGVSGSGKSTLSQTLKDYIITPQNNNRNYMDESLCVHLEADMYFKTPEGFYVYDPRSVVHAHAWCQSEARCACEDNTENIIISNTSTKEKDFKYYEDLAKEFGYKFVSLIVENRHGGTNIHDVPPENLEKQANNIKNNLKLL